MLGLLPDLLACVLGWETAVRSHVRGEVKRLHREQSFDCLYRDSPEQEWKQKTCRVVGGNILLTMYPFGASFTLTSAEVQVIGAGPRMTLGLSTILRVSSGDRAPELAVPDYALDWLVSRVRRPSASLPFSG